MSLAADELPAVRRVVRAAAAGVLRAGMVSAVTAVVVIAAAAGPAGAQTPTPVPTAVPTAVPTGVPTVVPTGVPTQVPTGVPTQVPTGVPTQVPTEVPTGVPTQVPTGVPTQVPTGVPTTTPTVEPTAVPSVVPTIAPTESPTLVPTAGPTAEPTPIPTADPSAAPTPTATAEPITTDFGVEDPYNCGGGFFGEISGGIAPYDLTYTLIPSVGAPVVLPVVVIDEPGAYITPDGLIDYTTISGPHMVVLIAADAGGATLNPAASFDAFITDQCSTATVGPPGTNVVVKIAPDFAMATEPGRYDLSATPTSEERSSAVSAPATAAPTLALTGSQTPALVLTALVFFCLGGMALISSRRRSG